MKLAQTLIFGSVVLILFCMFQCVVAQNEYSDLKVTELSSNVAVFSGSIQNVNNIAVKTDEGILIIDTGDNKEHGLVLRKAITKHFGTDNFKYIINTHHHSDHTGGNSAFPEVEIIAHSNFRIFIKDGKRLIPDQSQSYKKPELTEGGELPPPPPASSLNSFPYITVDQLNDSEQSDLLSSVPNIVFDQKLFLSIGELGIYLLYYGKAHTDNDIWVYIPQEGVLCTGDLFMKDLVPAFKGMDVENWLSTFDYVLEDQNKDLKYIIPGHYDMINPGQFVDYKDYIRGMYYGIQESLIKQGVSKNDLDSLFSLENKFPRLKNCDVIDNRGTGAHHANIKRIAEYFSK